MSELMLQDNPFFVLGVGPDAVGVCGRPTATDGARALTGTPNAPACILCVIVLHTRRHHQS